MIRGDQAPKEWEDSFIINCFKGKGDALLSRNYRGLKLLDQTMKVFLKKSWTPPSSKK